MMKNILLIISLFFITGITGISVSEEFEKHRVWITDSYYHGNSGNNCSDIYFNYGIKNWTVNSEDPGLLKKLYEACMTGKDDNATNKNSLPQILENLNMSK